MKIDYNKLHDILNNEDIFIKFIRFYDNKELFNETDITEYVETLNNYIKFLINKSYTLDRKMFEKINYINTYRKYNEQYDYEEYIDKTSPTISIETIMPFLNNELFYNKIMDYDNNKEFFNGMSLEDLYTELTNTIEYFNEHNIGIEQQLEERYNNIKDKYGKRIEEEKQRRLEEINEEIRKKSLPATEYEVKKQKINKKLEKIISKSINKNMDDFTKARAIYLKLGELLVYDETFFHLDQNINNETAKNIYNKKLSEISVEKNNVICKSWAELYCLLLNKNGIKASVASRKEKSLHKYVRININGEFITADATEAKLDPIDKSFLIDLTRIKLGLNTLGFTYENPTKGIDDKLNLTDENINYVSKDKDKEYLEIIEQYNKLNNIQEKNINEKISLIVNMIQNTTLTGIEAATYLKTLISVVITDKETININYCGKKVSETEYKTATVLDIKINEEINYYIYEDNNPIKRIEKEQLEELILTGELITFKNRNIRGINMVNESEEKYVR